MACKAMMTKDIYLPWASASAEPEYDLPPLGLGLSTQAFVDVTVVLHGKAPRSRALCVPARQAVVDFKGHLAVEGVVSTCGGLEISLEENGDVLADTSELELYTGQVIHLRRAAEMVSVTALTTAAGSNDTADEEVYELVLPSEVTGAALREKVAESTAGALVPVAIFVAEGEAMAPFAVGDDEQVQLANEQVIIVQRAPQSTEPSALVDAEQAPLAPVSSISSGGLRGSLGTLRDKLLGTRRSPAVANSVPNRFGLRCASNLKVKGAILSCASKAPWAGCAVFDVLDPAYFEITVQLMQDAPTAEADGFAGRWMLGVVPSAAAEVKTEKQRKQLLGLGHFLTVCHGHPAKIHAPSMPRGTCGEDCSMLPGELRKGQSLTLRWAATASGGVLTAQVDDCDAVSLPYAPAFFDDVRPCLVFGGKPTELRVLQLEFGVLGGA